MRLKPELHDLRPEQPGPALKSGLLYAGWLRPQPALWLGLRLALGVVGIYFLKNELTWLATILAIHLVGSWPERLVLGVGFGLALAACFGLAGRLSYPGSRSWLPGVMLGALLGALLPSASNLASLHRTLWPDPAVEMVAQGNFNGLEIDLERRVLYTAGYGVNYLLAYNLDGLGQPPLQSPVESGYAQGFGYNPVEQEVYVYNQQWQQLLFLEATTLALKKTVAIPQLAPGDAWVVWDKFSDRIIIASEADEAQGIPFIVIERQSGEVVSTLDLAPGFILPHPTKPLFYMTISFFQDKSDLIVYDIIEGKVVLSTPTPANLDRLAFAAYQGELELLAPSALGAEILRFDPETLAQKGAINSLFGARSIAVDPVHRLLLVGSLVTHRLEVVDLDSQQRLASYYVGPWLRSLSLDVETGQAYLSSHEGVFTIQYKDLLQGKR